MLVIVSRTITEVIVQCTQVAGGIPPRSGAAHSSTLGSYIAAATLDTPPLGQLCVCVCVCVFVLQLAPRVRRLELVRQQPAFSPTHPHQAEGQTYWKDSLVASERSLE